MNLRNPNRNNGSLMSGGGQVAAGAGAAAGSPFGNLAGYTTGFAPMMNVPIVATMPMTMNMPNMGGGAPVSPAVAPTASPATANNNNLNGNNGASTSNGNNQNTNENGVRTLSIKL